MTNTEENLMDKLIDYYNEQMYTIRIKKLKDNAIIPTRGSEEAAGIDLYACIDEPVVVDPGEQMVFGSGIACEFPMGYFGAVVPRSSVGIKRHLTLPNNVGIIDNDYRNEIMIAFKNIGDEPQTINPGERIAQMILLPYVTYNIVETDSLSDTERGLGGIGSTGK